MITPLDIENKRFAKQMMNGYSVEEVDEFLDEVIVDYSKYYRESVELKTKIEDLTARIDNYKNIEETLQKTLVMAQTTAEDIKKVAEQKAERIIGDAKGDAEKQIAQINAEILEGKKDFENSKKQFEIYKAKMEALLIAQLELLKDGTEI